MKTVFRPSDITFNISCDPSQVARAIASLRLFTRRVSQMKLEVIDMVEFSSRTMIVVSVSFKSWTPVNLGVVLTGLSQLREITKRPITECSWCYH